MVDKYIALGLTLKMDLRVPVGCRQNNIRSSDEYDGGYLESHSIRKVYIVT